MRAITICTGCLCLLLAGCGGPDATVEGTVTIDGQLANQGTVTFHPVRGGPTAYGTIAPNGSYALRIGLGDPGGDDAAEIRSGEYIVTAVVNMPSSRGEQLGVAEPPTPGARLSAERYASKETSDLRAKIQPGRNIVPLELDSTAEESVATDALDPPNEESHVDPHAEAPAEDAHEDRPEKDSSAEENTQ